MIRGKDSSKFGGKVLPVCQLKIFLRNLYFTSNCWISGFCPPSSKISQELYLFLSSGGKMLREGAVPCGPNGRSITIPLTPQNRVLPQKLTGNQIVRKFPAFHGTKKFFITTLTKAPTYPYLEALQSGPRPHPICLTSILILPSLLCLGLPSYIFHKCFPTKLLQALLIYRSM